MRAAERAQKSQLTLDAGAAELPANGSHPSQHAQKSHVPWDAAAVVAVPLLLSVSAVACLLGCSNRTVRRRITEGSLPAVIDHGRVMVRGDELRTYIDSLQRAGGPPRTPLSATHTRTARYEFLRQGDATGQAS